MESRHLSEWNDLIKSDGLKQQLFQHFQYLADSPNYTKVLVLILEKVVSADIENNKLVVYFEGGEVLKASAPAKKILSKFPKSFKDKIAVHEFLRLENACIELGDHGLFLDDNWIEELEYDESELIEATKGKLDQILSPMSDYSDLWLYHPKLKNEQKQPQLFFLSHEGGDIEDGQDINIGSLFLRRLAEILELDFESLLEKISSQEEAVNWWGSLEEQWKAFFSEKYDCDGSVKAVSRLWKEGELFCNDSFLINDLTPLLAFKKLNTLGVKVSKNTDLSVLEALPKLSELNLDYSEIEHINGISGLENLVALSIAGSRVQDISGLTSFKKLTTLDLSNSKVSDLGALENLKKLESLNINDTQVTSLAPLHKLKKLWYLYMDGVQIDDLNVFTELDNLRWLNIERSNLSDFKALSKAKNLSTIWAKDVPASLESCLEYINWVFDHPTSGFTMKCDYDSPFKLLPALKNISQNQEKNTEALMGLIHDVLGWYHKHEYREKVLEILEVIRKLKLNPVSLPRQEYTSTQLVYFLTKVEVPLENQFLEEIFSVFASQAKHSRVISMELAKYYGFIKNKPLTLKFIKQAKDLGVSPYNLKKEASFEFLLDDEDFINLQG